MTYLPNRHQAFVDIRKLQEYVLNPYHNRGKYKARVFTSLFGLDIDDAEALREYILAAVTTFEAQPAGYGEFGYQYKVDLYLPKFAGLTSPAL